MILYTHAPRHSPSLSVVPYGVQYRDNELLVFSSTVPFLQVRCSPAESIGQGQTPPPTKRDKIPVYNRSATNINFHVGKSVVQSGFLSPFAMAVPRPPQNACNFYWVQICKPQAWFWSAQARKVPLRLKMHQLNSLVSCGVMRFPKHACYPHPPPPYVVRPFSPPRLKPPSRDGAGLHQTVWLMRN